jgi:hypothetical protein
VQDLLQGGVEPRRPIVVPAGNGLVGSQVLAAQSLVGERGEGGEHDADGGPDDRAHEQSRQVRVRLAPQIEGEIERPQAGPEADLKPPDVAPGLHGSAAQAGGSLSGGCHSSILRPSGSVTQPNAP